MQLKIMKVKILGKNMKSKKMLIAEIIAAMGKNSITQEALAQRLNIYQSDISSILSQSKTASLEKLISLARAAGVKNSTIHRLICYLV